MGALPITARQFKALVTPVLPHAGRGGMMPILNAVRIETRGRWLVAIATDRFRAAVNRIERPEGCPADWAATIPLPAVKSIVSTFAPRRGEDADLSLTIEGGNLAVSAAGAMVGGFFDAAFKWPLESGEFPKIMSLIAKATADSANSGTKVRMTYMAGFEAADLLGQGLWMKSTGDPDRGPVVVTDGENFIGLVMPRRGGSEWPALDDWADVFGLTDAPVAPEAGAA